MTLVLSFLILLAAIAAMSIGIWFGRREIRGSCGGVNGGPCELCSSNPCPAEARDVMKTE